MYVCMYFMCIYIYIYLQLSTYIYIYVYHIMTSLTSPDSSPDFIGRETTVFYRHIDASYIQIVAETATICNLHRQPVELWPLNDQENYKNQPRIINLQKSKDQTETYPYQSLHTNPCQNYRAKLSPVRDNQEIIFCTCQRFQKIKPLTYLLGYHQH